MQLTRVASWWTFGAVAVAGVAGIAVADEGIRLSQAIKSGDVEATRALLESEADVNAAEPDGTTPLHWAANRSDPETAAALIENGASVNASNRYGVTPLVAACMGTGDVAVVELLLDAGADPDSAMPSGQSALMTAARSGKADVVDLLVARGADIEAREQWRGQNALMWAAAEGHPDTIKTLVEAGADVHARTNAGFTPILFAVRAGHIAATEVLLNVGAIVNDKVAPVPGQPVIEILPGFPQLERAGGPGGTSALVVAIANAHYELANVLLEHGADPNAAEQGWTALHQLAHTRRPNLGKGIAPPEPTGTIDSLELAGRLIAHGADVNARMTRDIPMDFSSRNALNRIGATAFVLAAKTGDTPFMQFLADNGAHATIRTEEGTSALMVAAGVGIQNVGESRGTNEEAFAGVQLAYDLGDRDVNVIDANGKTALHGAAMRGSNEIVQFLAHKGARLDVVDSDGWLPLTIADGVFYTGTIKRAEHTAVVLRQLMRERGVLPAELEVPSLTVSVSKKTRR
jgi:ankyrin repeat protein